VVVERVAVETLPDIDDGRNGDRMSVQCSSLENEVTGLYDHVP
jgi:hypothetical protein